MASRNRKNKKEKEIKLDTSTNLLCPICKTPLKSAILNNVEVKYCPNCLGLWFEEDELRMAKDNKDKNLSWLDIDLWDEENKFKISPGIRLCPSCGVPLYEVRYGDSNIIVDVCNICHGVWLDRAEFKKIIDYLHEKSDDEILNNAGKNLFHELGEIFIGPESLKEEINDFQIVLKLLSYKFAAKHPLISEIILSLPK